ncbi:acyl-CoA N-acyltransferase [Exidia glandulosa HHB12029]|uniref:Acyl-CoA N-acyltransferase n=1 Tax=Exidia glandulosa HHB12029 TaxID=1314781 RepID=A0A165NTS0_EXIGL|nr:acyl-CoA N-acyltransferase [Exidia glandulosa HHB12029]
MPHVFPVKDLETDRLRLEVFNREKHIPLYWAALSTAPETNRYMPFLAIDSLEAAFAWYDRTFTNDTSGSRALWATYDLSSSSSAPVFAGVIGLLNSSAENLMTEIGFVTTFPSFQRTHVNTHACGLLLKYCLGDLKLRRVQWQAHADNGPSRRAAERLGFKFEGIARWQRVLPADREGHKRPGDEERPGRHSVVLAVCWDDWEEPGFQEALQAKMDRRA